MQQPNFVHWPLQREKDLLRHSVQRFISLILATVLVMSVSASLYAQAAPDPFACYGIADEFNGNGNTDGLAVINRLDGTAQIIGTGTGTAGIEALAFVPQDVGGTVQQVLFATADPTNPDTISSNTLGTVDIATGVWTALDPAVQIGSGTDANGTTFDFSTSGDIDGLTYDVQRDILWATQRNSGDSNPDYLLQLDPATGQIVPDAFGAGIDWVEVPLAADPAFVTSAGLPYDDVDDLAVDPVTGRVFIINNKGGSGGGLVELNPVTGAPVNYIGLFSGTTSADGIVDDMEGLAFFNDGVMYGSTGNNGPDLADLNKLFVIDVATGATTFIGDFPTETKDIEALGCLTAPAFITLEKATNGQDADQPTGPTVTVGDPVTWIYVIENTGSVPLINMSLDDDIEGDISGRCEEGALPNPFNAGDTFTCTVVGTATTEGQYANVGTVDAIYVAPGPGGDVEVPLSATDPSHYIGEPAPAVPGISIVKTAGDAADGEVYTIEAPGLVLFTYVVENTGDTHLTNITIADDAGTADTGDDVLLTSAECADLAGPLAPDGIVTCTAEIQVNGDATNVATTTGTPTDETGTPLPGVEPPTDNDPADVVYAPPTPGISIVKTAGDAADGEVYTIEAPGPVLFTYVVENTGGTYLTNITITDDAGTPTDTSDDVTIPSADATCDGDLAGPLAPGGRVTCTVEIQVSADAANVTITNIAETTGAPTDPDGNPLPGVEPPTDNDPADVIYAPPTPGISIIKTAGDAADGEVYTIEAPGPVLFTYVVENTGGTYLTNITITDDAGTPTDTSDDVTIPSADAACDGDLAGPLAPGDRVTCTVEIQVSADAANVTVTNIAETTGAPTDPDGNPLPGVEPPTDNDPADVVYAPPTPGISIIKTAGDAADGSVYEADGAGLVLFTYVVENTGGTYLTNITITDDAGTADDASDDETIDSTTCPDLAGPLAPGGAVTCTAQIQVNGDAVNVADTTGTPTDPDGNPLPGVELPTASDDAEVILLGSIGDTVWLDTNNDGVIDPGETGIPGVDVILTLPDGSTLTATTDGDGLYLFPDLPAGDYTVSIDTSTLPPGVAQTYDADGLATADESSLTLAPGEDNLDQDFGYIPAAPGIDIVKTAGDAADGDVLVIDAPALVTYLYVVTNTGNTYLTDVTITDDLGTADAGDDVLITNAECAGLAGPLAPGGTVTCATDIQVSGDVVNVAVTTGTPADEDGDPLPDSVPPTADDDAEVDYDPPTPGISIIKTAGDAADGATYTIDAPGVVTFHYEVTNSGGTYLTNITITDDAGTADTSDDVTVNSAVCAELAGPVAPGNSVNCIAGIMVNGDALNLATTTGNPTDENGNDLPDVDDPTDDDPAAVEYVPGVPGIQIVKTAGNAADGEMFVIDESQLVTFKYVVTNIGDTYLSDMTISDDAGTMSDTSDDVTVTSAECAGLSGPLAPGGEVSCTAEIQVNDGAINNAETTGAPTDENGNPLPGVEPPSDEDDAVVAIPGSIGDTIWMDTNNDGVQGPDETGIPNVTVTLTLPDGSTMTTVTNADGLYLFADLSAGDYVVTVDAATLPPGVVQTYDADGIATNHESSLALSPGENNLEQDFGYVLLEPGLEIEKTVYQGHDSGAGCPGGERESGANEPITYCFAIINTGDTYLVGIVVNDNDLDIDQSDMSVLSGSEPLAPGDELVFYYETVLVQDLINTAEGVGTPSDADGNPIPGLPRPRDEDIAQVSTVASLGDYVWFDRNADGSQEPSEAGLEGVTVNLLDSAGEIVETTATDADGFYLFDNLTPGDYAIEVLPPVEGYLITPQDNVDDNLDSDINEETGRSELTTLEPNERDTTLDAGFWAPPRLMIEKRAQEDLTQPGETIIYEIAYSNSGVGDASGVVITEVIPRDTNFLPQRSTPGWVCEGGSIEAGALCSFEISFLPAGGANDGMIFFAVRANSEIPIEIDTINNQVIIGDDGSNGPQLDGQTVDSYVVDIQRPTDIGFSGEPGVSSGQTERVFLPLVGRRIDPTSRQPYTLSMDQQLMAWVCKLMNNIGWESDACYIEVEVN